MNHNLNVKVIAVAVAALASASAQAVIVTSSNSGATSYSELVVVAYDDTKVGTGQGVTYVRGLGVQMDAFLPNSPLNGNVAINAGAATVFAGGTRTPELGALFSNAAAAGDATWAAFTTQVGNLNNIRWGVIGRKAGNASVAGQYPAAVYTGSAAPTNNSQVGTLSSAFNFLMNIANEPSVPSSCLNSAFDSCITELDIGANLGANVTFNGVGTLADVLPFNLAFKNINTNSQALPPAFVQFCNSFDCADWSINSTTGEVTYTLAAAPVDQPPTTLIPVPAAGWLLLTGLAGMVGLSRRKRNAA